MPALSPTSTILAALRFSHPDLSGVGAFDDADWREVLEFCDNAKLTLSLARIGSTLPDWVRERLEKNLSDNAKRFERIVEAYAEIAFALAHSGIEHLVLKGFSTFPGTADPRMRRQGDIDIYCSPDVVYGARDLLLTLGYQPAKGLDGSPSDHLPVMVRKTDWQWRGNFFDPDLPIPIDLHFQFWNCPHTRIYPRGLDQFWCRRRIIRIAHLDVPALHAADTLAYSALHALRHLLHGTFAAHNAYELADFLNENVLNREFWASWNDLHDDSLRRLQAVCFRLAADWFHCELPEEIALEINRLPRAVQSWCDQFAESLLGGSIRPNKDALWLHLSLIESARDKIFIFRHAIFPSRLPAVEDVNRQSAYAGKGKSSTVRYLGHVIRRAFYHAAQLPRTASDGMRWWLSSNRSRRNIAIFLIASFFYTSGMYVFFLLFNLFLLDRGYKEDFIGLVTGALSIGGMAGTIPAGWLAQKVGLRKALLTCFTSVPLLFSLRVLLPGMASQITLALLCGAAASIWGVSVSPILAQLTHEKNRPRGFSLLFASGIGFGVLANAVGGSMPVWLSRVAPSASAGQLKQVTLLFACAFIALAIWPARYLQLSQASASGKQFWPRNKFVLRFLPIIAIWSFATGAFMPFANAYFSQQWKISTLRIGGIFSASQFMQMLAILAAPYVFRKLGPIGGIVCTQFITAMLLACVAASGSATAAAITFIGYAAFQWMSEPGIYSVLMSRVEPHERAGASSLNAFVISLAQALAAVVAGASLNRFGYRPVLLGTATVALLAAALFCLRFRSSQSQAISQATAPLAVID